MNRDYRKKVAQETLEILRSGAYSCNGTAVSIGESHEKAINNSVLITPEVAAKLLQELPVPATGQPAKITVENCSTLSAILDWEARSVQRVGVLNFASAKNPGGGFLGGAVAQEESLAIASGLYYCQTKKAAYYEANRACRTMRYTDHAIYSPQVVFFRDDSLALLARPVVASVLTLPAVNMGQVLQKGEDVGLAKETMKNRMRLALAIFSSQGDKNLILGAYGCGVFRNSPQEVAKWWQELLEEGYGRLFDHIHFAVLDNSKTQDCIRAFQQEFGT